MKKIVTALYVLFPIITLILPPSLKAISIEGSKSITIKKEYLETLPHGRTTGSILENWLTPVVFLPVETGGLSRVDDPRFSIRGISWVEQNWRLNGVDITDPFRSGTPLFEPPWNFINRIQLWSSQETDPHNLGLDWGVDLPETHKKHRISYSSIFTPGGGLLIPGGIMDREPSFPYGSPEERRRYKFSGEIDGSYFITKRLYLGGEILITEREFPTLKDKEEAGKYTLISVYRNNIAPAAYKVIFLTQFYQNNNLGASRRFDRNNTIDQKSLVLHLQGNASKRLSKGELKILSGITTRLEKRLSHLEGPRVMEFDTESGPVPQAGDINRFNFDNSLNYRYGIFNLETCAQITGVFFKPEIPFFKTLERIDENTFFVTIWDRTEKSNEFIYNGRIKSGLSKTWNFFSLAGNVYLDNSRAFANGEGRLNWYGAGGKILSRFNIQKTKTGIAIGALHRPSKLNSHIVSFLNNKRPSGERYLWNDLIGNNIDEDSEVSLISTTGGKYHHKDEDLKRPCQDELFVGIEQGIGNHFKILLQGAVRALTNYFIVDYETYNGTYTTIDGYELYKKPPGRDEYYLSNYKGERGLYSGVETQFIGEWNKIYVNLMGAAFMVRGFAPIGNGPDFNDYAVISEETASHNSRINAVGRLDSDRAYMGNLLIGYRITRDLSFGSTVKYRDGEPFSQHIILRDSDGLPIRVMRNPRGEWEKGGMRYTFSWNVDMRLRYSPTIRGKKFIVAFDMYNIIGSATEILESYKVEDNRKSLEAVPPRMIKLTISYIF